MYLSELILKLLHIARGLDKDPPARFFIDDKGWTSDYEITTRCGVVKDQQEVVEIQIEPIYKG